MTNRLLACRVKTLRRRFLRLITKKPPQTTFRLSGLAQPKSLPKGFVRLIDGQTLSLGDKRKIVSVSDRSLQLQENENGGGKLTIPIDQVAAIDLGE